MDTIDPVIAEDQIDIEVEKTRNYTFLMYPDSCLKNWREELKALHVPFLVSPLHTGEKKNGEPLKPHWHVIICFGGNKTPEQVRSLCKVIHAVPPPQNKDFVVQDLSMMCRYLYHADDPDKPQYNPLTVEVYGPIDFESLRRSDKETANMLMEITYHVYKSKCRSFIKFMLECANKKPDWFQACSKKNTFYVQSIIKSNREDIDEIENTKCAQ